MREDGDEEKENRKGSELKGERKKGWDKKGFQFMYELVNEIGKLFINHPQR